MLILVFQSTKYFNIFWYECLWVHLGFYPFFSLIQNVHAFLVKEIYYNIAIAKECIYLSNMLGSLVCFFLFMFFLKKIKPHKFNKLYFLIIGYICITFDLVKIELLLYVNLHPSSLIWY